jgi:type I restriction enzyme S subunit
MATQAAAKTKAVDGPWELPEGWEWVPLGTPGLTEIIMGQSPPGTSYNSERDGLPFFQGKAEFGDLYPTAVKWCNDPRKVAYPGDVLISVRAPVGPTNLAQEECCIGRGLAAIRPSDDIHTRYLLYALRAHEPELSASGRGSTFAAINKDELSSLAIPLPFPHDHGRSMETQHRIVARIEALLAEVKRAREILEQMRRDAELVMDATLEEIFGGLEHNQVRSKSLGSLLLCKPQYGTSQKASDVPQGLPILRMGNIANGRIYLDNLKYVQLSSQEQKKYILHPGDILFNRTNSAELVGKSAVFDSPVRIVFASYLIRLVPDPDKATSQYIAAYINSRLGRDYIRSQLTRAIGQVNVNAKKLAAMPIPLPDLKNQEWIISQLHSIQSQTDEMQQLLDQDEKILDQLEQSILERAFRGEL